ncbi:MAG: PAS domain S-box protein [bacterium]
MNTPDFFGAEDRKAIGKGTQVVLTMGKSSRVNRAMETEKKQRAAEESLKQDEDQYRMLIGNMQDGVFIIQDGKMQFVNEALARMVGYRVEEIIGMHCHKLVAPEDIQRVAYRYYRRLVGKNNPRDFRFRMLHKDGITRVMVIVNVGLCTYRGRVASMGTVKDISESYRAEEALRISEEKYRSLFRESKHAVFISTPEGRLLDINAAGMELFGYASKDEILQIDIAKDLYVNPRDREVLTQMLEEKGFVKEYELVLKRKDGKKLIVLESVTAIRDKHGKIVAYQGILQDLTERKRQEEQLFHAQKVETVSAITGGIAHDFNNLLTVILGNAEFGIQESRPGDLIYEDLLRIKKAATQARNLISQLLNFSRQQVLKPRPVNLNKSLQDLLKMLKHIIGNKIELKTELDPELARIWADPIQIQQVLMNLCLNARDAMPGGGKLILESRNVSGDDIKNLVPSKERSANYVELKIIDTGVGMDKKTRTRIFQPFFTTKDVGKGTGLGLSVVYGIVKQHNGHIQVFSEKGKGTTFRIYFPAMVDLKSTYHKKKEVRKPPGGDETILVVEDEEVVRNVTVRLLKSLGYSVLTARNGNEAIKVFKAQHEEIDLVMLDVALPKSSGPEVYKRMRCVKPNLSALFVTGYDVIPELDELNRLEQHCVRTLQKPYTKESLGRAVLELLEHEEKRLWQKS